MKKITFFIAFLGFGAFAQTFPTPYCEIIEYFDVEEITGVDFSGTSMTNTDATSILLDFTSTVVNVSQGQTYTVTVKGNTYGDYENEYVAFVDWNHNNILDDAGEVFYIGLIYDSDGNDSEDASVDITVPNNAVLGNTRIRIVKTYTDALFGFTLISDPCNIQVEVEDFGPDTSYGQALDFTLNVSTLAVRSFDKDMITVYPNPATNVLNLKGDLIINEVSVYNLRGQKVINKTDLINGQINVSDLATGQYLVKINAEGLQQTYKFIKQ